MRYRTTATAVFLLAACTSSTEVPTVDILAPPDSCVHDMAGDTPSQIPVERLRVVLDPYEVAPLSALVAIQGVSKDCVRTVHIRVEAEGAETLSATLPFNDSYERNYGCPEHVDEREIGVPVLGLVPDTSNFVRIEIVEDTVVHTAELSIETEPLHESLPDVIIVTSEPASMEPGWNLAAFSAGENGFKPRPFVFDGDGTIRWVLRVDEAVGPGFVTPMEPFRNGNLLLAVGGTAFEYSLLGREIARWLLPDGFEQHHDVYEMPDGHLLVCAQYKDTPIVTANGTELNSSGDQIIELDRETGAIRNRWDLRRFLDIDRYTYMRTGSGNDWFHLNSVVYDPEDDSIVVSGKHQGMAKITRGGINLDNPEANKELRWILAPHRGWQRAGFDGNGIELGPYLLTAVDDDGQPYDDDVQDGIASREDFGWVYSQHAPVLLENGDLFVFDNGDNRDLGRYPNDDFSRGVAFGINESPDGVGGTIEQVWEYGRERGAELYDPAISDVDEGAATGNRFVLPGSYTTTPDGSVGGAAKMVELRTEDRHVVFEAHILMQGKEAWGNDICYRQERMSLYPGTR